MGCLLVIWMIFLLFVLSGMLAEAWMLVFDTLPAQEARKGLQDGGLVFAIAGAPFLVVVWLRWDAIVRWWEDEKGVDRKFFGAAPVVMVALCTFFIVLGTQDEQKYVRPFKSHIPEYTAAFEEGDAPKPYVAGKVVVIRRGDFRADPVLNDDVIKSDKPGDEVDKSFVQRLLPSLVAGTPEEVGTIIWLEWKRTVVRQYKYGTTAARLECNITVIDWKLKKVVGKATLSGSDPPTPETTTQGANLKGSLPYDAVVDFVTGLPRHP